MLGVSKNDIQFHKHFIRLKNEESLTLDVKVIIMKNKNSDKLVNLQQWNFFCQRNRKSLTEILEKYASNLTLGNKQVMMTNVLFNRAT